MDRKMIARELLGMAKNLTAVVAVGETNVEEMMKDAMPELERRLKVITGFDVYLIKTAEGSRWLTYNHVVKSSQMGVFSVVFKRVAIEATVSKDLLSDGSVHVGIDMRWEHKNGGSNGGDVATAWFYPDKGTWTIQEGR